LRDGLLHVVRKRRAVLWGLILVSGHTIRHTGFSDGDPCFPEYSLPHAGDEITEKGVEIRFPGAFLHRRKKGLNRPNWTADPFLDGLWHTELKRGTVLGGVDPGPGTCDPAYRFLRRRSSREPGAGRQKCAKNAALLHTFLRWARYAARLPKYTRFLAL